MSDIKECLKRQKQRLYEAEKQLDPSRHFAVITGKGPTATGKFGKLGYAPTLQKAKALAKDLLKKQGFEWYRIDKWTGEWDQADGSSVYTDTAKVHHSNTYDRDFRHKYSVAFYPPKEHKFESRDIVEGKMSKSDQKSLVHHYAIAHHSNAPVKVAQKHADKYKAILKKYEAEYAPHGWSSDFIDMLSRKAQGYWSKKAVKGPGVDW